MAEWIGGDYEGFETAGDVFNKGFHLPCGVLLRKEFEIPREVVRARVYVCGLGWYELRINGCRIGDRVLDPAQSDYKKRVYYSTYDVTGYWRKGGVPSSGVKRVPCL